MVAKAISEAYGRLFDLYPDAYERPVSELTDYFRVATGLGDRALQATVGTFQTLCSFGDFGQIDHTSAAESPHGDDDQEAAVATGALTVDRAPASQPPYRQTTGRPPVVINVNIELSITATQDAQIYDAFFAAMAKHIITLQNNAESATDNT